MTSRKVMVLGVTGMLGHILFRTLRHYPQYRCTGTARNIGNAASFFTKTEQDDIYSGIDAENYETLQGLLLREKPDTVINCIGIIKQLPQAQNEILSIRINALLPHLLAKDCARIRASMIQIGTDCVFNGKRGDYLETDLSDATDLYGKTKFLGEVVNQPHVLTLRTSIIGHELSTSVSLIDWFLSQKQAINGFSRAIYTGLPTCEFSTLIAEKVLPAEGKSGLYHVSSEKIDKYNLLKLVASTYGKNIKIHKTEDFILDRSLLSEPFRRDFAYTPPSWETLVRQMHQSYIDNQYPLWKRG